MISEIAESNKTEDNKMKLYGSLQNRLAEGRQSVEEIKVGTGVTEYYWSDRQPYEIIEVYDQKHFRMRLLDHKHVGNGSMDNNWELVSNENNPEYELVKRGDIWYFTNTVTADDIKGKEDDMELRLNMALAGFDWDKIMEKGKQTKRRKANISIGVASYYYDYEF